MGSVAYLDAQVCRCAPCEYCGIPESLPFYVDFPRFNQAIERYVTADYNRENLDATWDYVPGLSFLLFDIFGFIDDSIDSCVPYSVPRGDCAGAVRKAEYSEA